MKLLKALLLMIFVVGFIAGCGSGEENQNDVNTQVVGGGGSTDGNDNSENGDSEETEDKDKPGSSSFTVAFEKGKTSRSYSNSVPLGSEHKYSLSASKGQLMTVTVTSGGKNAFFDVHDPVGNKLNDGENGNMSFSTNLPSDGKYRITVFGVRDKADYKVNFSVGAKAPVEDEDEGEDEPAGGLTTNVKFGKGKSSASYKDAVIRGERNTYVLGAGKGQTMNVSISSLEDNAVFQISGPGGYLSGAKPGDDTKSWSGPLPANGNYKIIVGGTRGNASYTVTFSIK